MGTQRKRIVNKKFKEDGGVCGEFINGEYNHYQLLEGTCIKPTTKIYIVKVKSKYDNKYHVLSLFSSRKKALKQIGELIQEAWICKQDYHSHPNKYRLSAEGLDVAYYRNKDSELYND